MPNAFERIGRAYVAEQARKARIQRRAEKRRALAAGDRAENALRIREQVEGPPRDRGCKQCGDPYAAVDADSICERCEFTSWVAGAMDKLSPDELYPEHFPEREVEDDE